MSASLQEKTATAIEESKRDQWATPPAVYLPLAIEFNIGLDACATEENHKAPAFITPEMDGLTMDWRKYRDAHCKPDQAVWVNAPYSHMWEWAVKARAEADAGLVVVFLAEARIETAWYRHLALAPMDTPNQTMVDAGRLVANADIRMVYPRIPFIVPSGITQKSQTGMIGSVVVILGTGVKQVTWYNWREAAIRLI